MYYIEKMPSQIDIGFTGELMFRKVEIDMSAWMEEMPEGVPSIVHIRPGETESDAYIAATTFENNILTWDITNSDLGSVEGVGTAQIWLEEEANESIVKRGKSILVATMIHQSINDADETPPAPQTGWMEQMTALKVTTVNAAETAKNISSHAPQVDADTGNWLVWDQYLGQYVDTGKSSKGQIGAKSFTFTLDDVTNVSGEYEHSTDISASTDTMKPIALEVGTPSVFGGPITVTCNNGTITLSCSSVSGTSTIKVIVEETAQSPYEMFLTSEEYAVLDERIGALANLTTTDKDSIVDAVNEIDAEKYVKPDNGIPSSDMASDVQTSLGKADTAYQKPSGGVPKNDLSSGVQTSLGKADSAYQKPVSGIPSTDLASGVLTSIIDDTAGDGTTNKVWSANKSFDTNDAIQRSMNNYYIGAGNLERGSFTNGSGKFNNNKRIRLTQPFFVLKGTKFSFSVGSLYWTLNELSSPITTGGNSLYSSGWNTATEYVAKNDCWIMVVFANGATESESTSITVSDFGNYYVKCVGETYFITKDDIIEPYHITSINLESGGFSSDSGKASFESLRIRNVTPFFMPKDSLIKFEIGNLYWGVWELSTPATTGGNVLSSTTWKQDKTYTVKNDCYIMLNFANGASYGSSTRISVSDFDGCYVCKGEKEEEVNTNILYLGDFVQAGHNATAFTTSTQRLCMKDCVALPYGSKTVLHVQIAAGYLFAVRAGKTSQNLSSNKYWYNNGDTVTFTSGEQYYRVIFAKGTNGNYQTITTSDIANIKPVITYSLAIEGEEDDLTANSENFETLTNSQNVLSASSHGGTGTLAIIVHISDLHGDMERTKMAIKYADRCGADAVIMSGDIVGNTPHDNAGWLHSLMANMTAKPVVCTGNHDVNQSGFTDANVYEYLMEPSKTILGNTSETTYYYTDIASKKLRIISCDLYQSGGTTRSNAHMSSDQLSYICTALKGTPNDYGVIIVAHSPCVDVSSLADENYSTFFQSLRKYGFSHYDITGTPIYDIVDAFIARTTISKTYTQTGSPSSITVTDDFSSVSSSVEFIAHVTGHIHEDSVCYLPTTQKQLMLNVSCCVPMVGGSSYPYLADDCDITRLPYGKTQNCINFYVIDRTNKKVKITRVGGTRTYDRKVRDYMEIPYAD